jgi:recombinational DNA repair protein (RecF pathway)
MEQIEKFEAPVLPKMLGGNVMCVDAKAWNSLIDYVTKQTFFINKIVDLLNKVSAKELDDSEAIQHLATILKEHLEE